MKQYFLDFLKKPLIVKLPLMAILLISFYYLSIFLYDTYSTSKINEEVKNFKFEVSEVYFESRFDKRSYSDKYLVVKTKTTISKEQFSKMSFTIPQEEVRAELSGDKEVKVYFISPFRKNISSQLVVSFNGKRIYNFDFMTSIFDKEDRKNNPINEVDKF